MRNTLASFTIVAVLSASALAEDGSSIGYPTVAAALEAVKSDPNAHVETKGGWTIVATAENGNQVLWSFAPESDPAYPSAVKRTVVESGGKVAIDMKVLCQSTKAACDKLVEQFQQLNERVKQGIHRGA